MVILGLINLSSILISLISSIISKIFLTNSLVIFYYSVVYLIETCISLIIICFPKLSFILYRYYIKSPSSVLILFSTLSIIFFFISFLNIGKILLLNSKIFIFVYNNWSYYSLVSYIKFCTLRLKIWTLYWLSKSSNY